jgi:AcrR family transcriptional regulator
MNIRSDGARRREAIVAATASALLEQGFALTTTRDVARRLDIGAGLINHYFQFADLRAEAFAQAFLSQLEPANPTNAAAAIEEFFTFAFHPDADGLWRLWIEAVDLSVRDAALRAALMDCNARLLQDLAAIISLGQRQGAWVIADPDSTAMRLIGLHAGLLGFILTGDPSLSRADAETHLRECFRLHVANPAHADTS